MGDTLFFTTDTHLVWITKYRYRVMNHEIKKRVRELVAQAAEEVGVKILNGVVSSDHVYIFVEIPPHIPVSDFVKRAKGKSFVQDTTRISAAEEGILGETLLGTGVFQCYEW